MSNIRFVPSSDDVYISTDEKWGLILRLDGIYMLYEMNSDGVYVFSGMKFESLKDVEDYLDCLTT
jgi:hypothetical protein